MRVLLLCDDYGHPGLVPTEGTAMLAEKGFEFDVVSDAGDFSCDMLARYKVVLLAKSDNVSQSDKSSWKTEAVQQAFVDYVENGGGLLAVHSAVVSGKNDAVFDNLIGCRFISHPHEAPIMVQPVKPHPVTADVHMFCENDEQYRLEMITPDADVLIASYSPPQGDESMHDEDPYNNVRARICPAGYVRTQGKGRVCVIVPGHTHAVWKNPQFQKTLENALHWCSGT